MPAPGDLYNPYRMFHGCFIPNAVLRCRDLSARAKLVFGRLCQYAGENGEAYPSYRALAQEVGVERRRAISAVRELENFGLVRSVSRRRKDGGLASNFYVFLWHGIFEEHPEILPPGVQKDTRGGDVADTTPRCRSGHQVVPERTPKEIQTKESVLAKTTTAVIRSLLAGTPLLAVADRELQALQQRHGQELLQLAADIAAETWRRDPDEIRNPGGYLQALCSSLIVPDWYEPAEQRQARALARQEKRQAEVQALQDEKAEAERQATLREDHWSSLSTKDRERFLAMVKAAYPNLHLPAIAITATAKSLAWEEKPSLEQQFGEHHDGL